MHWAVDAGWSISMSRDKIVAHYTHEFVFSFQCLAQSACSRCKFRGPMNHQLQSKRSAGSHG